MHAPIQLTLEEADYLAALLLGRESDTFDLPKRLREKIQRHHTLPGLGAMPGIRKADGENLYYIDDKRALIAALDSVLERFIPKHNRFYFSQEALEGWRSYLLSGECWDEDADGVKRHRIDGIALAILAHAFTVHNRKKIDAA